MVETQLNLPDDDSDEEEETQSDDEQIFKEKEEKQNTQKPRILLIAYENYENPQN